MQFISCFTKKHEFNKLKLKTVCFNLIAYYENIDLNLVFSEHKTQKVIRQKDYLKKYLSGGKKKKQKVKIKKRYFYSKLDLQLFRQIIFIFNFALF